MKPQVYLPHDFRQHFISQIKRFVDIYSLKLKPVFTNIDIEAEEHANHFFKEALKYDYRDYSIELSDIADEAKDRAAKHWDMLNHGRYVLIASWHVALYEAFEQQMRSYLIRELKHDYQFESRYFFSYLKDFREIFSKYGVNLESIKGLEQIEQLGLLCNVIKHGDGGSAIQLREKRPDLIKTIDDIELLDFYGYSLFEEVLEIGEFTLMEFGNAIVSFWESFPERSFCDDTDSIKQLLKKCRAPRHY